MKLTLKLDAEGRAVIRNGKPVYTKEDGTEIEFDANQAFTKIGQLTGENTDYKKRFTEAESKVKAFEGIDDPAKAIEALKTVANIEAKKLVDAGEIDKVKAEISKSFQTKLDEANAKSQTLEQQLYSEMVGGAFARSEYIKTKMAIPADMAQAYFGGRFVIEEGRVVAKDANGNKLYSGKTPGELAGFDEAIEMLVNQYPGRDRILRGSGSSGGGAPGGGGSGSQTMTLTEQHLQRKQQTS